MEDKFKASSWLTLSGGVRVSHFSEAFADGITENVASPRMESRSGSPRSIGFSMGFMDISIRRHPDARFPAPRFPTYRNSPGIPHDSSRYSANAEEEQQFGVTIPFRGWSLDADNFRTRAGKFFDHNNVGESDVFIPVTLSEALIRGWELTLKSPASGKARNFTWPIPTR